jgi:hypothetical protein
MNRTNYRVGFTKKGSEPNRKKGPNDFRSGRVVDGAAKVEIKRYGPKKGQRIAVVKGRLELIDR